MDKHLSVIQIYRLRQNPLAGLKIPCLLLLLFLASLFSTSPFLTEDGQHWKEKKTWSLQTCTEMLELDSSTWVDDHSLQGHVASCQIQESRWNCIYCSWSMQICSLLHSRCFCRYPTFLATRIVAWRHKQRLCRRLSHLPPKNKTTADISSYCCFGSDATAVKNIWTQIAFP